MKYLIWGILITEHWYNRIVHKNNNPIPRKTKYKPNENKEDTQ